MSSRIMLPPWYETLHQRAEISAGVRAFRETKALLVVPTGMGATLQTNLTAAARSGTTVTASGTPHTKGSWASLIDPTSKPSYGIWVRVKGVANGATNTSQLMDIGYGPTGGGNEEILIPNFDTGYAFALTASIGKVLYMPCYIPSGTRVSARLQAAIASDTAVVAIWLEQDPIYAWHGGKIDAYGADAANSRGTSVTPGSGAFGTWTQLAASTNRAHRFWNVAYSGLGDTTVVNAEMLVQLGVGPDSSNVSVIHECSMIQGSGEEVEGPFPPGPSFSPVPAGNIIFGRIASGETEARSLIAYGMD